MPPAVIAWLDYSQADQRRAREIVAMFSQAESRDELGLGQIRDALSDTLFPGTSVLLTRARYLLFVPWIYREGARRGRQGPQLSSWVDWHERRLIDALSNGGDREGLIGRVAGAAIQNLPSTIYWNSLRRFAILRDDGSPSQIGSHRQMARPSNDATEFVEHSDAVWDPSMPGPPEDFFALSNCNFALTGDEATWLAERICQSAPDTLLQFLVAKGTRRQELARFAWDDPEVKAAPEQMLDGVDQAERFAVAMHGAGLLYNILLAERAEELGLSQHEGQREYFAGRLEEWHDEIERSDPNRWDLDRLWALVAAQGRPVSPVTRAFVAQWTWLITERSGQTFTEYSNARTLIRERELRQKRGQARLRNDRLMRQWGGASGSGRLNFRWPVVARLLNDIAEGRGYGNAGS